MKTNLVPAARSLACFAIGAGVLLAASVALAGTATNTYDNLGRLTQVLYSSGTKLVYVYDAAGNRSSYVVTGSPG